MAELIPPDGRRCALAGVLAAVLGLGLLAFAGLPFARDRLSRCAA